MKKTIFIFLVCLPLIAITNIKLRNNIIHSNKKIPISKANYISNNPDIVGHIKIANTKIDYDITKTSNNEFYLNHNTNKEPDKHGSIFIDYRNNLTDKKLLIYGHNSKNNWSLLKDLEKYLEEDFFENNEIINLNLNDHSYIYQIFSVMIIKENDYRHTQIKFSEEEYFKHLSWIKNSSLYQKDLNLNKEDNIIMIQTCYYYPENSYLIISAKRRDNEKNN